MLCGSKSLLLSVIEAEIACTLCHITTTLTMLRCRDAENWVSWGSCQGVVAVVGAAVCCCCCCKSHVASCKLHFQGLLTELSEPGDKRVSCILMAERQAYKQGKFCANNCNCLISVTEQGVSHSIARCICRS